jgi:hypothetical protein
MSPEKKRGYLQPEKSQPRVIYLYERKFSMNQNNYSRFHPLRLMGYETADVLSAGNFGALLARAGVGKTAFLVQLALHSMMASKKVLHISLSDPVGKVCRWYEEVFRNIAFQYGLKPAQQIWETALPHRFIMTFKTDGFTVPKLEERITDLTGQNIFFPRLIVIDGFPFNEFARETLLEFKKLVSKLELPVWFTVKTHRHEDPGPEGMPIVFAPISDLFEIAIELKPDGKGILVAPMKGHPPVHADLKLDPSTLLVKNG